MSRLIGTAIIVWLVAAIAILSPPSVVKGQVPMTGAGLGAPPSGSSYTGPGNIVSGAVAWWGLRAYSAAKTGTKIANVCNSGDANCADINSLTNGNFDVTTAQGAPLNCGGAGGTCTVKTLYDQSGSTNCSSAVCDVTDSTIATRPTLTFNCLNTSLPCLTFVRTSNQVLNNVGGISSFSQPNTVSLVMSTSQASTSLVALDTGGNILEGFNFATSPNIAQYAGATQNNVAMVVTTLYSIQGTLNGASSQLYVNGTGTAGSAGAQAVSGEIFFGNSSFAGNDYDGKIAEIGVWNSDFSASSNANAHAMYLNQKAYWGTP